MCCRAPLTCPFNNPLAADLKYKLQEAQFQQDQNQQQPSYQHRPFMPSGSASAKSVTSMSPPERPPSSSLFPSPSPPQSHAGIMLPQASLNLSAESSDHAQLCNNEELAGYDVPQVTGQSIKPDPFMDLLFLGWNPELPEPVVLSRLCVCLSDYTGSTLTFRC
jgi:hypothetical protein